MKRGMTGIEVLAALALLGAVAWFVKPSLFRGQAKRAAASTQATAAAGSQTIQAGCPPARNVKTAKGSGSVAK